MEFGSSRTLKRGEISLGVKILSIKIKNESRN